MIKMVTLFGIVVILSLSCGRRRCLEDHDYDDCSEVRDAYENCTAADNLIEIYTIYRDCCNGQITR